MHQSSSVCFSTVRIFIPWPHYFVLNTWELQNKDKNNIFESQNDPFYLINGRHFLISDQINSIFTEYQDKCSISSSSLIRQAQTLPFTVQTVTATLLLRQRKLHQFVFSHILWNSVICLRTALRMINLTVDTHFNPHWAEGKFNGGD